MTKIAQRTREQEHDSAVTERNEESRTRIARATVQTGADVARDIAKISRSAAGAAEDVDQATRQLTKEAPEFNRAFTELLEEQTRESVDALNVFARSVNWSDVLQAQSKLVTSSFMRISQFNARYGQFMLRGMTAMQTSPRR